MAGARSAAPSRAGIRLSGLVALIVCAMASIAAIAEPKFPPLSGRIVDEADLLSAEDHAALNAQLAALETASTDQLVVVTLKSLQGYSIEDFGYRLGRHWGIGQKGKDNGLLLIVAPKERKVRIEVGYGLEPVMTDAMSKLIIDNAILPAFRRGDFPGGIRAGVRDIKDVLLGDVDAVKERAHRMRRSEGADTMQVLLFLFWLGIVLYLMWAFFRSSLYGHKASLGRRGTSKSGGWGGGWSGGGGGGWSGGGGGFGGGGSSGGW